MQRIKKVMIMENREDYISMKTAERMTLFDNIENDAEFEVRKKFLRIICEMELNLRNMYEYFIPIQKMKISDDIWQIGLFDHVPIDKEHKLVSIQICYRRFNPYVNISCGKRRMTLYIDDDDNLQASLIDWWRDRGTFDYDQEALAIQSMLIAYYLPNMGK
jgi:hypothetical protein